MGAKNTRPRGSFADVKELEYISALHQTGKNELRIDGSIHAIDIVHFLESRYGIKATVEEVRERILSAFGQCARSREASIRPDQNDVTICENIVPDNDEMTVSDGGCIKNEEGRLDLTQILALLLVPLLLKAERSLVQEKQKQFELHSAPPTLVSDRENGEEKMTAGHPEDTLRNISLHESPPCFAMKGDKRPPDADLIDNVLRMMMHDATGDPNPRPLTKDLVRQLLCFYGEEEIAEDERLLDEMMMAATSSIPPGTTPDVEEPALFDQHAFVRALTHDVQQYNVDNENHLTTNYYDVFQTCYSTKERGKKNLLDRLINPMKTLEAGGEGTDIRPVRRVFTFPSIDYTADTFRSKGFVVLLWVTWILTYFSYLFGSSDALALVQLNCDRTHFWCPILQGITNWLIIGVQLIILGTVFIVWASFGNSIHPTNPLWIVLAMGAVVLFVLLPHFKDFDLEVISSKKKGATDQRLLYRLSATCGFLLLFASLLNLSQRLLPERWFKNTFAAKFCTPGVVRHEADFKQAASYKVNQLVRNACQIHKTAELDGGVSNDVGETKYGRAMLAYARTSDEREEFGGFMWTWKKIYNGELFRDEGVWFTTHLLAGNVAQFFICLILGALFIQFYQSELFQEGLKYLDALPIETHGSERWRLMLPLFFGVIWGEILILVIAANYIPSTVNTILQYRSGGESSLHKKKFLKLRFAVDHSSLLFGSIFWGTLYTSIISGFFAMVALGIILWPDFAVLVLDIFANIIGIGITMFIKWIALIGFRRKYAKAYYRKNVSLTNFVGVILESWNLGLTTSYMIIRSFKLLVAATLFIGRVDVPFLSEHVCFLGPFELDAYPLMFRKDLLAHEAHRHPYIERLGMMYMMKLRHDNFGNYAGTCWRLLLVYALMPWMRKFRNSDRLNVSDLKFAANRLWTGRIPLQPELNEVSDALTPTDRSDTSKESSSIESNPKEAIDQLTVLKRENETLKKENSQLRSLLFHRRCGKELMTNSCPPKIFSYDSADENFS